MANKILRTVSVTLHPEEVTKLIKSYLEKEGFEVRNVDFKVAQEVKGFGMDEHLVLEFKGCNVECRLLTERIEDV